MTEKIKPPSISRRTVVGAALAAGAVNLAPPFIRSARAADSVKIGLNNPLTGTYAALGTNELIGAQFAVEQMNAKVRHSGRPVELLFRGLDQRRCRHGGPEDSQADRARRGEFHFGQRQLGTVNSPWRR